MIIRVSKSLCVCAIAFFISLSAFNNLTDYNINFTFIQHVLTMDSIFYDATIKYRAIDSPILHHFAYITIIMLEIISSLICWWGGIRLFQNRNKSAAIFNRSKNMAIIGLTLAFVLWQTLFMSIGGEWFAMWMSKQWNSVPNAFRFFVTVLLVLIYVASQDSDRESTSSVTY